MDYNKFEYYVDKAENILRGIENKVQNISDDEWLKMQLFIPAKRLSDEETISLQKDAYIWRMKLHEEEYNSGFYREDEEVFRCIEKVWDNIKSDEIDFCTLEKVVYSILCMYYMSRTYGENYEKFDISKIVSKCKLEGEREYLQLVNDVIYMNWICGKQVIDEIEEKVSTRDIDVLIDEAINIYPQGETLYMLKEVNCLREFLVNYNKQTLCDLKKICFSEKGKKLLDKVMLPSSPSVRTVDRPGRRFLPQIKYIFGQDFEQSDEDEERQNRPCGFWEGGEEEFQEKYDQWKEECIKNFLKAPYILRIPKTEGEILGKLVCSLVENIEKRDKLEEITKDKNDMVSDFTHRYKNLSADNLYQIAHTLINTTNEDLQERGRELLVEYDNKQMLTREVVMLNLEHTGQFKQLVELIKKGKQTSLKNGVNIQYIINESLKRNLIRILVSAGEDRVEKIRNKFDDRGIDTWKLLEDYEDDILRNNMACIDWINSNMMKFFVYFSKEWESLFLEKTSEATVFLMSLIMELVFNIFTYADISKDIKIKFDLCQEDEEEYLVIKTVNYIDKKQGGYTQKGLESRDRILNKLNYGGNYRNKKSIETNYEEDKKKYTVTVKILRDLII